MMVYGERGTRLIYGKDPWADGEEIALIVLALNPTGRSASQIAVYE